MNNDFERAMKRECRIAKLQRQRAAGLPNHATTETPRKTGSPLGLSTDINDYDTSRMTTQQREVAAALFATGFFKGYPRYEPDE